MAHRGSRMTDFEERDYYPPPRRSAPDFDGLDYRPRQVTRTPPGPRSRVATREHDEVDVRVRDRETDRTPAFLRDDGRRPEAGPMVLRQRDVETFDRHARSPSPPVRVREVVRRPKSASPPAMRGSEHEHTRTRVVERDRVRSPSVVRCRSPSPLPVRFVQRRRRSPSPAYSEHIRTRIVEKEKDRVPSPSPSPSPPPPPTVIRGPTIEREVITHWTDIDHGRVRAKPPSPPPAPRPRARERETDIDINLSKNRTEVDIHQSSSRPRSKSRERRSRREEEDVVVRRDGDRLRVEEYSSSRRRAQSAAPLGSPMDDEGEYLTSKIDSRGRMGEAWGGATKDWAIVDVPPGTERVRMDGAGGGSTDTTWTKYSGVRRTQFVPERDGCVVAREPSPDSSRDRTSVGGYDREREIDVDIDRRITRTPAQPPPPPTKDMWTEITKDLVVREAIEELGYEYEETKCFFYIMDYLRYDDVIRLTDLSESIRRQRKERVRDIQWDRDWRDEWERPFRRHQPDSHDRWRSSRDDWDDERVREQEVVYDSRRPARGYFR